MSFFKGKEAFALVKVSDELHKKIQAMKTDELGTIRVNNNEMTLFVKSDKPERSDAYQLQLEKIDKTSILVIETPAEKAEKKYMTPRLIPYKGTCLINDENKLQANISAGFKETFKSIAPKTMLTTSNNSSMSRFEQPIKPRQEAQRKDRRERMERNELEKLLFDIFSDYDKRTFKEISDETQQPKGYLEGVLKGICDMQSSKEGKFYVLKQEFKIKSNQSPSTETVDNLKETPYKKIKPNP